MRSRSQCANQHQQTETRCAIYTRKSSEDGLEQEFNSLHAQREACQAYILSQRHEGWRALPTLYDDGGISGGTLERPALARLLEDVRANRIDLIVIYKVDRLTRSLADFAKLVDVLNAHNVSFVSVTQQFNTATSMGRLTLNMLLSFAQFEREVTGERIRDKIAASKRKGMWMGGHPPLGYDVRDRKLIVNDKEAAQVVIIFRIYLERGSVSLLQEQLIADGITTKRRQSVSGPIGGRAFTRGNLYEMLKNRLYRGEIAHHGNIYSGEHAAIIDLELWNDVQAKLADHRVDRSATAGALQTSLLAGILYDAAGNRMTPTHARKGTKRYRYYVSKHLITSARAAHADGQRIPAGELESLVTTAVRNFIGSPDRLIAAMGEYLNGAVEQRHLLDAAAQLAAEWDHLSSDRVMKIVNDLVDRVVIYRDRVEVRIGLSKLSAVLPGWRPAAPSHISSEYGAPMYTVTIPAALQRAGQEMRLVIEGAGRKANLDPTLAKLIQQALQFRNQLLATQDAGIAELASRAGVSGSHFTRVLRLGFLAPDILTAIGDGRQPISLTATKLQQDTRLPLLWADQRKLLGFPPVN
jgi:DNA invertase Pin-like site-specific DNA recombinase